MHAWLNVIITADKAIIKSWITRNTYELCTSKMWNANCLGKKGRSSSSEVRVWVNFDIGGAVSALQIIQQYDGTCQTRCVTDAFWDGTSPRPSEGSENQAKQLGYKTQISRDLFVVNINVPSLPTKSWKKLINCYTQRSHDHQGA